MDFEADFLINPLSYILGAVSVVGFFVVARSEVKLWLQGLFGKHCPEGAVNSIVHPREQNVRKITQPCDRFSTILGLIFMGIVFSVVIYYINAEAEQLEPKIRLREFLLIIFAFTMLPGGLAGMAAGAWISATNRSHESNLLERLLTGMLAYIAFVLLVELTEFHILLFLSGPVVTLIVYRFSPVYKQRRSLPR